ncbi:MAG: tRNA (N(6)-L-threonylcarbamoyladenosine(37)-C(2))-methylthiotransferase MtaB [Bacteroidales bacterium]|nr:tRNA (N(6)-L-threonylcarbamoyladenosine(37)-C(2))-methylthiotransferase MtaB [Candidatus Cryptobacteroides aphodequi]
MMKAAFLTLGCKLNYAETSTYTRDFAQRGWQIVSPREQADLYVINTCSVTATSDAKSRNLVRRVHRTAPSARIVVTGCSAQLREEVFKAMEGVSLVIGCNDKALLVDRAVALFAAEAPQQASSAAKPETCPQGPAEPETCPAGKPSAMPEGVFAAYSTGERTRSFLKVQDGCNNFCAYCTVPYARGRSRNVPVCECVRAAKAIAAEGVKEIVLTGVNTGDFGRTTGESFLSLLKALHEVDGIERYRISSIEPNLLTDEIIDWIATKGVKFQPHFHIPLQTGCDALLKTMGRHYDTAFFASRLEYIRRAFAAAGRPQVFFGIDVMVGLPGESPERFLETVDFIKSVRPAFIHVFPYSRRPGTRADLMPDQVNEAEKKRRVAVLEGLSTDFNDEFIKSNKGVTLEILFESREKDGTMGGYTGNYIRVTRPYDASLVGKIVEQTL